MDKELARYYEARMSMMGDEAWKDLMEDVQRMYDSTNDLTPVQDEKTLHFRRGELSIMKWLLNLKAASETTFQQLKDDHAGA